MELIQVEHPKRKKKHWANPLKNTWNMPGLSKNLIFNLPDGRIPDETIIVRYNPDYIQCA